MATVKRPVPGPGGTAEDRAIMATWPGGQMPAGWSGGPRTPQGAANPYAQAQQYGGHAQYDPQLFAEWKQQHPNDPRAFTGMQGLPQDYANKVYDARGQQLWQQAVVNQANQPNNGQRPMPQGGLSRTTPGIEGADDPVWRQRGMDLFNRQAAMAQGQQYTGPSYNPQHPTGGPGVGGTPATGPTKNPVTGPPVAGQTGPGSAQAWQKLAAANQKQAAPAGAPDFAKIRSGMKPGQTQKIGGKSYFLNQNGALVDVSDPKNRKRLTDIQGNVLGQTATPPAAPQQTQPPVTQQGAPPADWQQQMQDRFQQMQDQLSQQFQNYQQRPSYYPGASPMDPYGGGMAQGFGGYGGGFSMPMQNFMQGFGGGYGGGFGADAMGMGGGYGGGMTSPNMMYAGGGGFDESGLGYANQLMGGMGGGSAMQSPYGIMSPDMMYAPEAYQMNPYNPNMQMY